MTKSGWWWLAAAMVALAGCETTGSDEGGDPIDDAFLAGGKVDAFGISEGGGEACGVLNLVNTASVQVLDVDVGLDKRAAQHIVAHRAGAEGRFDDLAELDAVPYVGKKAFRKLLDYTYDHDLVCQTLSLRVVTISDWHGQLDPVAVPGTGNVGGAAALAAYFAAERAAQPNTLVLTAGDGFGATPPLASFFEEKPAVLAMNLMGFDADGVGNHNFDRGTAHFAEMAELATFPYLSANLDGADDVLACPSKPDGRCVAPYRIVSFSGLKVAIVGVTNPDAANLVKPGHMAGLTVTDPLMAALEARAAAAAEGAQVFVLIAHMGATGLQGGVTPVGPLLDLAAGTAGYFDVIVGDHTNVQVSEMIGSVPVVENRSNGVTFARIDLTWDFAAGGLSGTPTVAFVTPLADAVAPVMAVVEMLAPFRAQLAAAFDGKIAVTSGVFERGMNVERLREVPLGNLVAESIRARYGTQLAFINGGGLRAPLPSSYAPADKTLRRTAAGYVAGPPYDLVVGDVYTVLPFGNSVVTRTVTGAQLWAMCEHGVEALPNANGWFPQIAGFRFTFDSTKPVGQRVLTVTLADGTPIAKDETRYTLATSDFLDAGGDGYTMLAGSDGVSRDKMAEVLQAYIAQQGSLTPTTDGRIDDVSTP
jgi:5'-nucleotidase